MIGKLNSNFSQVLEELKIVNGNQRTRVEDDSDAKLTYSGAFDFVDGVSRTTKTDGSKDYV